MIAFIKLTLVILATVVTTATPAGAARRGALVIGNSAYRHAGELANPRNDATDIAAALRKSDFQVLKPSMSTSLPLIARSATLHQPSQTPRPACSSMRGMVFRWPRACRHACREV